MKKICMAAAAALLVLSTASARAQIDHTFPADGPAFFTEFNGFSDGTVFPELSAELTLTLASGAGTDTWTFNYSLENTSDVTSTLSAFGFDVDPNISSASVTGVFTEVGSGSIANATSVEVCFKNSEGGSCSGPGGVLMGDTGTGTLTLVFSEDVDSVTLSNFAVRYQAIAGLGNVTSATGVAVPGPVAGAGIPALALLGGIWLFRRRRKMPAAA